MRLKEGDELVLTRTILAHKYEVKGVEKESFTYGETYVVYYINFDQVIICCDQGHFWRFYQMGKYKDKDKGDETWDKYFVTKKQ